MHEKTPYANRGLSEKPFASLQREKSSEYLKKGRFMLRLNENLKKELSQAIIDFWITCPEKYLEVCELIQSHGSYNATAVMLEEVWIMSEGLVDKTFLYLIQGLFPILHQVLDEEFKYISGRTRDVSNS